MIDMEASQNRFDFGQIVVLQRMKTGALFEYCCESAAILACAGPDHEERLRNYARDIGLLFQITDDLLDAVGSTEAAGKKTGKDAAQGKATILSILGVEGARAQARKLADSAVSVISAYGEKSNNLRRLAEYLVTRQS